MAASAIRRGDPPSSGRQKIDDSPLRAGESVLGWPEAERESNPAVRGEAEV